MEFGMPTLIEHTSLKESAAFCKELGFSFVELNMNFPQYQIEQLEKTEVLLAMAERYGIYYTIHLEEALNVCDFNQGVANAYLDTVKRTIAVAKRLHAPIINMHMNPGIYVTLPDRKVYLFEQYEEYYMQKIQAFRMMCENEAAGSGIHICIENTGGYHPFEQHAIEKLLESEVFRLTWDIGHSYAAGEVDYEFLLKHQDKLAHFHIHDGKGKKVHLTLGSGEIPLRERLALAEARNCRCVIETKTVQALRESVLWMKSSISE